MGNLLSYALGKVEPGPDDGMGLELDIRGRPRAVEDNLAEPRGRTGTFTYAGATPVVATVTTNDLERTVSHDPAGNELSYFATRTYSPRNLLARVTDLAEPEEPLVHTLTYAYDSRGVRVIRTESPTQGPGTSARRYHVYNPELNLLSVTRDDAPNVWGLSTQSVDKNVDYEIVWFAGRPIAQVTPAGPALHTYTDHLGTPILQTDATGTITWRAEYEPFGNVYEMRAGSRTAQPLRFPGQEVAMTWEGSEERYNVFRWYRAGWGRYTQSDPLGLAAGVNLYSYVDANPIRWSDPFGLIRPVHPSKQRYRDCYPDEEARCEVSCKYGMESCKVSQTFRVIRAKDGKVLHAWVDGPMSCSCREPDCWDKVKDWVKDMLPDPSPPALPLPPFVPPPIPPSVPTPKPVIPGLPPFFINPCMLNPSLCDDRTGIA